MTLFLKNFRNEDFTKSLSLSFRLFGNILADELSDIYIYIYTYIYIYIYIYLLYILINIYIY